MTVTERVAYLKGLFEGLGMDGDKKEGKLLKGMLDTLEELANTVTDLEQQNAELADELDEVYDEISCVQEDLWGDDEDDEPDFELDAELYQVVCPTCGESLYIDEGTLEEGSIQCPACGEELEFDLSALYETDFDDDDAEQVDNSDD